MASEQAGVRKKKSKTPLKEELPLPTLYRHQDCIPTPKLIQNCERPSLPEIKSNCECQGKFVKDRNDIKNKSKQLSSRVKNNDKLNKNLLLSVSNSEQSNDAVKNTEEFSKSRKRRLRKQRLLVALAPSLNPLDKPDSSFENNLQTKSIPNSDSHLNNVVPSASSTLKSNDSIKLSVKESRKRPDKSVGTRSKGLKTKSLVEQSNQSKSSLIKTIEEKTLNSLLQTLVPITNSSPKKETTSLPHFSFPEKKPNSSDKKVDEDGVFYFGETKHQLGKITSTFNQSNTNIEFEKSEFTQNPELKNNCLPFDKSNILENSASPFNLSPSHNNELGSLGAERQNIFSSETVLASNSENKRICFPDSSECRTEELLFNSAPLIDSNHAQPSTTNGLIPFDSGIEKISNPAFVIQSVCSTSKSLTESEQYPIQRAVLGLVKNSTSTMEFDGDAVKSNKTREEVKFEREAKKAAKLAAKAKHKSAQAGAQHHEACADATLAGLAKHKSPLAGKKDDETCVPEKTAINQNDHGIGREMRNIKLDSGTLAVFSHAKDNRVPNNFETFKSSSSFNQEVPSGVISEESPKDVKPDTKSKAELRTERRAKQEAQRAAKSQSKSAQSQPQKTVVKIKNEQPKAEASLVQLEKKPESSKLHHTQPKPKLFSHLYQEKKPVSSKVLKEGCLHPAIVRLGVQYASRVVVGSNARCVALLHALKQMVNDYTTPSEKEFSRGLEEEIGQATIYLNQCRPLAVSMTNALRHIKRTLTQLPNNIPDIEARRKLCDIVDTYIHEQVDKAGEAICDKVKQKIADGDIILTYGCSSLVYQILVESHLSGTKFRVVVVDGLPWREGREMLRRLVDKGLSCTYVLLTAASFIMREASKVLLGAHALLANGYVMSRAGSSQVALLAHCHNVPVLVCCETHKFSERVQTDAFVYNELGELCCDNKKDKEKGRALSSLTPLSLAYDITPPDLVSAVVTELAVLPCTSVPVILRIKPSESVM